MNPDLRTSVGPLLLERPSILASGILGISLDVFSRIYESGAGAVVTKSLSVEPWEGYPNPTILEIGNGGWLNAVGLSNPGAKNFAKIISTNSKVPVIVSLVGSVEQDFESMINEFDPSTISGFELNLSCPHVEKVGLEVGDDLDLVSKIIKKTKSITKLPIIAKIGLGKTDYLETVKIAKESGADAITAINTVRATAIDVETQRPFLSHKIGGLSGSPIKPIGLRCVYEIASNFDIPIIGCGGISNWKDAIEYILAGASAFQLGSIIGKDWIDVFNSINQGITDYMKRKDYSKISEMVGVATKF